MPNPLNPPLPSMPQSSKPSGGFGTGNSFSKSKLSKALGERGVHDDAVKKIIADKAKSLGSGTSMSRGSREDLAKKINAARDEGEISSYSAEQAKKMINKMGKE